MCYLYNQLIWVFSYIIFKRLGFYVLYLMHLIKIGFILTYFIDGN